MPSYLDLGVLAVIFVSALLAMLRGFTREILAIASWIAAAAAGAYLFPFLVPYLKPYIAKEPWTQIASATIIFFVALILVSIITVNLSDAVLDSKVGALDRSLGFLFGAARGFILCVIAFLFFTMLDPPEKQPGWVTNAKMRPLLTSVGTDMQAMLPHDLLNKIMKKGGAPAEEPPPENAAGDNGTDDTGANSRADAEKDSSVPLPTPAPRDRGAADGGKGQ